ncbi:MAG: ELM1/GtrOC1 family putative glycosyltransferase [Campylobacterota bacterium]|nr:ELM1/GtrOC1 family putative glycosyltransferase [Campylobacterota bacterium]
MPTSTNKKLLIISDAKPGHVNQSIAFAKLMGYEYRILEVGFKQRWFKTLGYVLSKFKIFNLNLFNYEKCMINDLTSYEFVIGAGSSTYYFVQCIASRYTMKSLVMMLPQGFDYAGFDYIIAQEHDNPPLKDNIIRIPVNLSVNEPKGYLQKSRKKSLGIVLGGNNAVFTMDVKTIKDTLDTIFAQYPNHEKYITTSRRTPKAIEELLLKYSFEYILVYSKQPEINPIPDFIDICDELFISIDSTSMLSEARANSEANIHVIDLKAKRFNTKFHKIAQIIQNIDRKIDFSEYLKQIKL